MLKHENTDVCRTCGTADAGVFCWGGKGAERVAIKYRVATLPSACKARSHLPFQGRYIRPVEG